MPDETTPTHEFPFEVPDNFAALTDGELTAFSTQVNEYASQYVGRNDLTESDVLALEATATLAMPLRREMDGRAARATRGGNAASALAALQNTATTFAATASAPAPSVSVTGGEDEDGDDTPEALEGEVVPAVTASAAGRRPSVRDVARGTTAPAIPQQSEERTAYAVMRASADVPHFTSGQELTRFADAARALSNRIDQYPTMTAGRAKGTRGKRPVTAYDPNGRQLTMTHFARHGGVQFVRQFPDQLRVEEGGGNGYAVAEFAANERNLAAGSLLKSASARVAGGRAITAAAAWCAPSEVIYELCELETLDGMLSVPELQTSRGGWQIPIDGGPNFAYIWNNIGNAGDTHLTETEVENDVAKVCTEIPCPDFEDVRLGVDYVCLTGGLLQRRGYPEIVARFSRGAMIALAHKINMGVIATMVAASGPAVQIPQVATGDDAASSLLSGVELAIVDTKYRNRMAFSSTIEVVMPMWFLAQIRAALARRRGVLALAVTDAEVLDWFSIRKAVPQFVYDWQDAFSGLAGGPGGASPLEALPLTGQFLTYPAGTWVKAVQDVVSLDTIYDSTNLQTNQYTAIFAEDGWNMLQMCPDSRLYEVTLDPSGVVGCCPPELISL